jgi:hypothetical protein
MSLGLKGKVGGEGHAPVLINDDEDIKCLQLAHHLSHSQSVLFIQEQSMTRTKCAGQNNLTLIWAAIF